MSIRRPVEEWRGPFGDSYIDRNPMSEDLLRTKLQDWARIIAPLRGRRVETILEVGANVGQNLAPLSKLTNATLFAVEPNAKARSKLATTGYIDPANIREATADALPFADGSMDLVFTCGVLIHIPPEGLAAACAEMHRVSRRFVLAMEYFAAEPTEKKYHDREGMLFLRDYGAYWLQQAPDLDVIDYGFCWKPFSGESFNWWLMEKRAP